MAVLKTHNEKYQQQIKEMNDENDRNVNLSNELKVHLSDLQDKLKEEEGNKEKIAQFQEQIKKGYEYVGNMQSEMKSKDETIEEYENELDQYEKEAEEANKYQKIDREKIAELETKIQKLQKESDLVRKENERIEMERAVEDNKKANEILELKKAASILEKNVLHLTNEKLEIQKQLIQEKERYSKVIKKIANKESQTLISGSQMFAKSLQSDTDLIEKLQSKLVQKDEELNKAQTFANNINQEFIKSKDKLINTQANLEKLETIIEEKHKIILDLEEEKKKLFEANTDLAKRRETAKTEITKLTQQIHRQSSKAPKPEDAKHSKIGQHISEAVISSQSHNNTQPMTFEKELILNTKKELDLFYKDLIKSIFSENKEGNYNS